LPAGGAGVPAESTIAIGSVLANRYEVEEILGSGGMGVVYRVFDRQLKESVALKTLHPSVAAAEPGLLERFKQEIRLARRITHRNVVRTHDLGESGGILFLTMELVEGTPLDQLISRRGKLPLDVTLPIIKQILRALEVAHEAGVIHRDIKPGNVIVQTSGFVKVMDFGIARLIEGRFRQTAITQAGSVVGSPDYMAPEQLLGEAVDHRVDIYSAGCVMFECLTGRRVFEAPHVMALISRHLDRERPDPAALEGLPAAVIAVVEKALAREPSGRWASAGVMLEAVEALG
jgi:serine/threonine protein kinase